MLGVGLIIAGVLFGTFSQMLYVKMHHPYVGRHHSNIDEDLRREVEPEYHPDPDLLQFRELWLSRIDRSNQFMIAPIHLLEEYAEQAYAKQLENWKWAKVPTDEWPLAWRMTG